MSIIIDRASLEWLKNEHEDLKLLYEGSKLIGIEWILQFSMNHFTNEYANSWRIKDSGFINCTFKIKIINLDSLPSVFETNGQIIKYAKEKNMDLFDLHHGKEGYCCLFPSNQWRIISKKDLYLKEFIVKRIYTYFYSIEYFLQNSIWPFGEYPHGIRGCIKAFNEENTENQKLIAEDTLKLLKGKLSKLNYLRLLGLVKRKKWRIDGHEKCLCGSNKLLKNCHAYEFRNFIKNFTNLRAI